MVALLLPALYVAIALHHPELLNRTLLLILAESEETAPLSLTTEAIGILLVYEIIREAGLRLPQAVGGAVWRNPLLLIRPCHRVVAATGPGGYAAGSGAKAWLLAHEAATASPAN